MGVSRIIVSGGKREGNGRKKRGGRGRGKGVGKENKQGYIEAVPV